VTGNDTGSGWLMASVSSAQFRRVRFELCCPARHGGWNAFVSEGFPLFLHICRACEPGWRGSNRQYGEGKKPIPSKY
jgi:hypothetical protein